MDSLLRGLKVLDLTQYLSGPFGTQILGDLGAEVFKVEPPVGDLSRTVPPYEVAGVSTYYLAVNRNKLGMVLDLKTEAGREAIHSLVPHVDVVVENFRPGIADRLGVGWDELRALNPQLVMCSVSGFGQTGPLRDLPAFDMVVQGLAGVMSLTGHPGERPARTGVPIGDLAAGMYGAIGLLAGVVNARTTGVGSHVDVAMLDSQIAMLSYLASGYLASGEIPGRQGSAHQSVPTYRTFTCADGVDVVVTANTDGMWVSLCLALDLGDMAADPRFDTHAQRLANRSTLEPLLEKAFAGIPSKTIVERLLGRVPVAPINDVAHALEDPQAVHRGMVVDLVSDDGTVARSVGNPVKVGGITDPVAYPPGLGEHTEDILHRIAGLGAERIRELAQAGAFGKVTTDV
ncbi:CoA transferase [Rhodococcus sp. 14-2483-1-2]|uniref:CaiB/BaiF CoA transferase family protein n=1 Tax=Rhodococcus sp. 14-2483-1-2 TaxID=2023147 RepID=UPI000B9B6074|nr:CoA transferase [Rhodococcus sp. 14-2483-1-2]OZF26072.1 carnitine dehydratase [Rhodococcus sp. 14-2483-1-2]